MTELELWRLEESIPLLTAWYRGVRRELPWRSSPTPYQVWISEIMLQQTRIEAAIPYYHRFLRELPDAAALAAVEDDRLMKLWEGLGYYSRARNLKKAAQILVERYGGRLPGTAAQLRSLPGIGPYTAGAIASIAFGEPEPAVDGNVLRVLSRLLACGEDVASTKTREHMTGLLRSRYPRGEEAALLTEGLMELGETVCVPNGEARCHECPLREKCLACAMDAVPDFPVKSPPKERRIERRTVLLLRCGERFAIRRREEKGLLAGLWEFPNREGEADAAALAEWLSKRGARVLSCADCGEAKHVFTHVEWHMRGMRASCDREADGLVWETAETILRDYPIPSAFRFFTGLLKREIS